MTTSRRMEEFLDFLRDQGYQNLRTLEDGTVVGSGDLMFTHALYIDLNEYGWSKRFCFEDKNLAISELNKLQSGDQEPSGFIARRNA